MQLVGVEPAYATGVLLVAPVASEQSATEFRGYVMAVISMRQLMADGLPKPERDNLVMQIIDTSDQQSRVLYASDTTLGDSGLVGARRLYPG